MRRRIAALVLAASLAGTGRAATPGDIDDDGRAGASDLVRLVRHLGVLALLPAAPAALADLDQDGAPGPLDLALMRELVLARTPPGDFVTRVVASPAHASQGVAVTRETILSLGRPLAPSTVPAPGALVARFAGEVLPATLYVTEARDELRLYYDDPLPASARIRVTLATAGLIDVFGQAVDGDGDGLPGGDALIEFDTLSLAIVPGTSVFGRVFASELGPGGGSLNVPLAGVTITVDGLQGSARTETDSMGSFVLDPAPVGSFFVHVDGRTATVGVPPGAYYPFVGKPWTSVRGTSTGQGDVFLPLVTQGTLQPVSLSSDTVLEFSPQAKAAHPELENVSLVVPADSLFADDGTRGGSVGIAPVPPDRLPGPLPPWLKFPVVITVQTDGATNFDRPAPACFPNLPDPITGELLEPQAKTALWSFNHDSGNWEIVGPMTVSPDGTVACTDPGVGVLAPGWHGTQRGSTGGGGFLGPTMGEPCIITGPRPRCGDGKVDMTVPAHCIHGDVPEFYDNDHDGIPDERDSICHPFCKYPVYEECDPGPDADPAECLKCLLPCGRTEKARLEGRLADPSIGAECTDVRCIVDQDNGDRFAHVPVREGKPCNAVFPPEFDLRDPRCVFKVCGGGSCQSADSFAAGAACNDRNECTTNDRCIDGTCAGSPVPDGSDCREPEDCVEKLCLAGECVAGDPLPNLSSCNDGKACTFGDRCLDGECIGVNPFVACPPIIGGLLSPASCLVPCTLEGDCGTGLCDPSGECVPVPFLEPEPCCGNGLVEEGEDCDDGNTTGDDGCNGICQEEGECGDGTTDDGEDCDDGNTDDGDGCSAECTEESDCGNGEIDRGEDCDDGNVEPGDACPPDCNTTLILVPELIVGFGDCSNGRQYRVLDGQGRDVTEDEAIELVTLDPGLTEGLINGLKQRFGGIICDPLDTLATIVVTPPTLSVTTPGLNFMKARRRDDHDIESNAAFLLGLPLALKDLELQPVATINGAFDLAVFATNAARTASRVDPLEVSAPMMLMRPSEADACESSSVRNNLLSTGVISVSNVKMDFACWEDVSLDGLLDEIERRLGGSGAATMEARLIRLAAGIGLGAFVELRPGGDQDGQPDPVLSVSHVSVAFPFFGIGAFVQAQASGASSVTATFAGIDCLGEAEGEMAVIVLPDIDGVDIRNEDSQVEDPIGMESCPPPYARRVHAVARAQFENAGFEIDFGTDVEGTQGAFELLREKFPGIGNLGAWTLPFGAQRNFNSGFYDEGDFFVEADLQVTSTQPLKIAVNSFMLQFPLPTGLAQWRVAPGAPGIVSVTEPGFLDPELFDVVLAPLATGNTTLQAQVCEFAADDGVIDFNAVRVSLGCGCGDGNVDAGETCDPPGGIAALGRPCRRSCTSCGDAMVQVVDGEDCDDGNAVDDDECPNDCQIPTGCGDRSVDEELGETCDPPGRRMLPGGLESQFGNLCRRDCTYCGDGIVQGSEQCDDGNLDDRDACTRSCIPPRRVNPEPDPKPGCGDGIVRFPESCERPGDLVPGTGKVCLSTCTFCGDGVLDAGEQCDDGNYVPGDGCEPDCSTTPPPCDHDGVVEPGEQCDDGNLVAGDGCEPTCTITGRPIIPPPPSVCITQVVTSPRQDWSGGGFIGLVGTGAVNDDDEFVEITNFGSVAIDIAGFVLSMTDATPCNHAIGSASGAAPAIGCRPDLQPFAGAVEVLQPPAPPFLLQPGGTLTIGNPPGAMGDDVLIEILSGRLVVASLEIGGNNAFDNFGADDDRDGTVNEDPRDGQDDDGDGFVDEDDAGFGVADDPVRDGAPGSGLTGRSTAIVVEALVRVRSTGQDVSDFRRGRATPGQRRATSGISIEEVVADPLEDWSGFLERGQATSGPVSAADQYVVIVNRGADVVSLRGAILHVEDGSPSDTELGASSLREHFSPGASVDAFPPCGVLVLVDPVGTIRGSAATISLLLPCVEPLAELTIGGPQGAPPLFGAPQSQTEALIRVQRTGNDAADFVRGLASPLQLNLGCP